MSMAQACGPNPTTEATESLSVGDQVQDGLLVPENVPGSLLRPPTPVIGHVVGSHWDPLEQLKWGVSHAAHLRHAGATWKGAGCIPALEQNVPRRGAGDRGGQRGDRNGPRSWYSSGALNWASPTRAAEGHFCPLF